MQNRIDVLELRRMTLASRDEKKEVEKFNIEINNSLGVIPLGTVFSHAAKIKSGDNVGYGFTHIEASDYYFVSEKEANVIKKLPNEVVLTDNERSANNHRIRMEESRKSAVVQQEKSRQGKIKEYKELEKFLSDKGIKVDDFPAMDVYVTTEKLAISKIKSKYEQFEKSFSREPLLPKIILEAKDMLKMINVQSENALKKLETENFIKDFGFTVEFNLNEEKDEVKVDVKDKTGKIVSSLLTNEVFFKDDEVEFTFVVEGYDRKLGEVSAEVKSSIDIDYMNLDIGIESDSKTKSVVVFEGGKELTDVSDSEYSKIYELFDTYSILKFDLSDISYGDDDFESKASIEFSEADFKDSSIGTTFADIDLTDKSDVMTWIRHTVNENHYDAQLISKLSEKMKSKTITSSVKPK
jgi:hypothetical protein